MTETRAADIASRPGVKVLGWGLIGLIGGGAAVASIAILALIIVIADVFVLERAPAATTYVTVVRQKGTAASGQDSWYIYELRNAAGTVSDAQLPLVAQPGDRLRIRNERTRILRLTIAAEAPVLCSGAEKCD